MSCKLQKLNVCYLNKPSQLQIFKEKTKELQSILIAVYLLRIYVLMLKYTFAALVSYLMTDLNCLQAGGPVDIVGVRVLGSLLPVPVSRYCPAVSSLWLSTEY